MGVGADWKPKSLSDDIEAELLTLEKEIIFVQHYENKLTKNIRPTVIYFTKYLLNVLKFWVYLDESFKILNFRGIQLFKGQL